MHNGEFVYMGNAQHITMFSFFGFSGLVEILHCYRFHVSKHTDSLRKFVKIASIWFAVRFIAASENGLHVLHTRIRH